MADSGRTRADAEDRAEHADTEAPPSPCLPQGVFETISATMRGAEERIPLLHSEENAASGGIFRVPPAELTA